MVMDISDGMKKTIENIIQNRLNRRLTDLEKKRILRPRGLLGYEAIIDYLNDSSKSNKELEEYLRSID
jgi:microsomal dipeptidase-like Zn-dependent dipeptidase